MYMYVRTYVHVRTYVRTYVRERLLLPYGYFDIRKVKWCAHNIQNVNGTHVHSAV